MLRARVWLYTCTPVDICIPVFVYCRVVVITLRLHTRKGVLTYGGMRIHVLYVNGKCNTAKLYTLTEKDNCTYAVIC